jgi:hypothetical protein
VTVKKGEWAISITRHDFCALVVALGPVLFLILEVLVLPHDSLPSRNGLPDLLVRGTICSSIGS